MKKERLGVFFLEKLEVDVELFALLQPVFSSFLDLLVTCESIMASKSSLFLCSPVEKKLGAKLP